MILNGYMAIRETKTFLSLLTVAYKAKIGAT